MCAVDRSTLALYGLTGVLFALSWMKDRTKTRLALKKAWKTLSGMVFLMGSIMLFAALGVVLVPQEVLVRVLGRESGFFGAFLASLVGAVTLIPAFVAFPTAKILLDAGAGVLQIGVFVSTLMMVGVVTLPLESRIFGRKAAVARNALAYLWSFVAGYVVFWAVR
jgi:uncharacterized membrane protein YraQ (UPF0718 family)